MRPDFRSFIGSSVVICHSAKGSEWEKHKYIKKLDGNYYYPDSYSGGRHLDDKNSNKDKRIATNADLDSDTVDTIARDVIRGLFGNGADREKALGENYRKIQDRVNEILRSSSSDSSKISESKEAEKKGNPLIQNTVNKLKKNNMRLDEVYSVYKKKGAK